MRAKVYIAQNSDSIGHLAEVIYALRCNFFTLKAGRGQHSKYLPFAFTREGIAMLSGLLRSEIAVQANISIMRAFFQMQEGIRALTPRHYLRLAMRPSRKGERKKKSSRLCWFNGKRYVKIESDPATE